MKLCLYFYNHCSLQRVVTSHLRELDIVEIDGECPGFERNCNCFWCGQSGRGWWQQPQVAGAYILWMICLVAIVWVAYQVSPCRNDSMDDVITDGTNNDIQGYTHLRYEQTLNYGFLPNKKLNDSFLVTAVDLISSRYGYVWNILLHKYMYSVRRTCCNIFRQNVCHFCLISVTKRI